MKWIAFGPLLIGQIRSTRMLACAAAVFLHPAGMFMVVAVDAEKLPVAAVGRVVGVVMVTVMHGQFAQSLPLELPATAAADVREEFQRPLPVAGLAHLFFLAHDCDDPVTFFGIGHNAHLFQ